MIKMKIPRTIGIPRWVAQEYERQGRKKPFSKWAVDALWDALNKK